MPDTIVRQKLRIPDKKPLGGDHSKYPVLQRSQNVFFIKSHEKYGKTPGIPADFPLIFASHTGSLGPKNRIPLPAIQLPRWR
jgi:hypothetical protein